MIALNNLANLLVDSDPDEALRYAQKAAEAAPDNASVLDTFGWIYYRNGIYDSALRCLKAAVDREATPVRQFHLAEAYLKTGDRQRGLALLNESLSKDHTLAATERGW